tara:strand:- start:9562 stop:9708 length:147 start_codon:yes stop_codon:yes gene_type:complete
MIFFEESSKPITIVVLKLLPKDLYSFRRNNQESLTKEMEIIVSIKIEN